MVDLVRLILVEEKMPLPKTYLVLQVAINETWGRIHFFETKAEAEAFADIPDIPGRYIKILMTGFARINDVTA